MLNTLVNLWRKIHDTNEFQTEPKPDIPFRMTDYRLRVYRRFPQKQMRQVVIYLQETASVSQSYRSR
ncbi:hypothetical protein [Phormidesmis priestleyi]